MLDTKSVKILLPLGSTADFTKECKEIHEKLSLEGSWGDYVQSVETTMEGHIWKIDKDFLKLLEEHSSEFYDLRRSQIGSSFSIKESESIYEGDVHCSLTDENGFAKLSILLDVDAHPTIESIVHLGQLGDVEEREEAEIILRTIMKTCQRGLEEITAMDADESA